MDQDKELNKKNKEDMNDTIDFTRYGESNAEYSLEELVEIYKKITNDIKNKK